MFYAVRVYRGTDPIPLATTHALQADAVEKALGDLVLGFRTLGFDIHRRVVGLEPAQHEVLDISLSRFKLTVSVEDPDTPAFRAVEYRP